HSEDNAENGGLYENVTKGQMVRSFNDWCFDAARKPGDTGIVETEYGYHVMYFVGEGENARYKMVTDEMKTNHQTAWVMKLTEGYEVKVNESGMSYTTRLQAQ
ncbi:MAG: peptidylprolyl isomerase, partial [Oscillospiraceae bacterium]|nr:peptidylprolyl isomerase [Oscillospiraceae bacterium]